MRYALVLCWLPLLTATAHTQEANVWRKLDKAVIVGQRADIPLGYDPAAKQFTILGGRTHFGEYKKPRSYDVLALDLKEGVWENQFPQGKDWGPRVGACTAPPWKNELFHFQDAAGTTRPNWTIYGTFALGQKYDYDPDTRAFYFYAGGRTFRYDPAARQWADLEPATHPEKELNGILLWSSMCYDRHSKRFVLFGGGNVQTERGDPGTWTYTPATNTWTQFKLDVQPPARANSRLAYDAAAKKIILFGGDQLDQLIADTWAFDAVANRWEQHKPARSPAPRGGHVLLWLPKAQKVLMLGGYTYTSATGYGSALYKSLPMEAWLYDTAQQSWQMLRMPAMPAPLTPANFFASAAAAADDSVLLYAGGAWLCALDAARVDEEGAAKHGVAPGSTVRRTGAHDPAWYREVPAADPDKLAEDLKKLQPNRWLVRVTPKTPQFNVDWGSAVFAPELDKMLRFSGGHSAYSGTAPQVYDVKTDRWSLPFAPEYPLEYVYSNDQVNGEWSFKGNPWMTGHTYKSTGYDPNLRALVFAPHDYTYFFDPKTSQWSRSTQKNPYRANFYTVTVCATPKGAVVWAESRAGGVGLWRLDATTRTWQALPLKGALPGTSADHHGMAYDAKRERLLLFSDVGPNKGDVAAYDLQTGVATWLKPAGREKALAHCRETIYLPDEDMVLIGAHVVDARRGYHWLAYDCAKNAWVGLALAGAANPIGNRPFNNSMGLMYDPNRRLIWAVGQYNHVHVLRLERATVGVLALE